MAVSVLTVPGWTGSGPDHWQSVWERDHPGWRRVEQDDWDDPRPERWTATLDAAVASCPAPPVLVAHSLGSIAVARWAVAGAAPARGAFLVAPPDVEAVDAPPEVARFGPRPLDRLPFPSLVVVGEDDPWVSTGTAGAMAGAWGAPLRVVGSGGHLNTESGHGPWPEGRRLLRRFMDWIESLESTRGDNA